MRLATWEVKVEFKIDQCVTRETTTLLEVLMVSYCTVNDHTLLTQPSGALPVKAWPKLLVVPGGCAEPEPLNRPRSPKAVVVRHRSARLPQRAQIPFGCSLNGADIVARWHCCLQSEAHRCPKVPANVIIPNAVLRQSNALYNADEKCSRSTRHTLSCLSTVRNAVVV